MIKIKFHHTPDQTLTGEIESYYDEMLIGSSKNDDLIIFDEGVFPHHLALVVKENKLFAKSADEEKAFHLGGKKTVGTRALNIGDQLRVGETNFEIVTFESSSKTTESLSERYQKAIQEDPDLESIFKNMEKELLNLEQKRMKSNKNGI